MILANTDKTEFFFLIKSRFDDNLRKSAPPLSLVGSLIVMKQAAGMHFAKVGRNRQETIKK
jgi:hypothetical protein